MSRSVSVSDSFKARADSASFYEAWVGSVLARAGLWTTHHPFTIAKSVRDIPAYAHTWDLDVSAQDPFDTVMAEGLGVEVKSVNLTFSSAKDYPFDSVLVCSQKSFLSKWPNSTTTQRDFLFVSRDTGSIVWLPEGTTVELGGDVYDDSRSELYKVVRAKRSSLRDLDEFVHKVASGS